MAYIVYILAGLGADLFNEIGDIDVTISLIG